MIEWFEELLGDAQGVRRGSDGYYREDQAERWLVSAESALAAAFPAAHPVLVRFRGLRKYAEQQRISVPAHSTFEEGRGVFEAALSLLKAGRLGSLLDSVRAETVSEVLDQADALVTKNPVAATVLAGGALETHLLHLCRRNGLSWSGDGSISKYDDAIAQARNSGTVTVYAASDTAQVKSWGASRNVAAHEPTKFNKLSAEVSLMVQGIRQFLSRVP